MQDSSREQTALEAQQMLVESSLELLFEAYDQAVHGGLEQPVVLLLDCEDAIGGEIARAWLGSDAVDDAIVDQHESDSPSETTVFAYAFSMNQCRKEIPAFFPYLDPVWRQPYPNDGFLALGITWGGASVLTVPFEARP